MQFPYSKRNTGCAGYLPVSIKGSFVRENRELEEVNPPARNHPYLLTRPPQRWSRVLVLLLRSLTLFSLRPAA
jgi:hypothetical protein